MAKLWSHWIGMDLADAGVVSDLDTIVRIVAEVLAKELVGAEVVES